MRHMTKRAMRYSLLLFAVLFSFVVLLDAASRITQQFDPGTALAINPLNSQARLKHVQKNIEKAIETKDTEALKATLKRGIEMDPAEPRFYSLYGMLIESEGEVQEAQGYYQHALSLVPTEGYALIRQRKDNKFYRLSSIFGFSVTR